MKFGVSYPLYKEAKFQAKDIQYGYLVITDLRIVMWEEFWILRKATYIYINL